MSLISCVLKADTKHYALINALIRNTRFEMFQTDLLRAIRSQRSASRSEHILERVHWLIVGQQAANVQAQRVVIYIHYSAGSCLFFFASLLSHTWTCTGRIRLEMRYVLWHGVCLSVTSECSIETGGPIGFF